MFNEFIKGIKQSKYDNSQGYVFDNIWSSYEYVILKSLLATFGLDFLINDIKGGDVDTIRGVKEGDYKKEANRKAYESLEEYDKNKYHQQKNYREKINNAKKEYKENGTLIQDAYNPDNKLVPDSARQRSVHQKPNLDHVIPAIEIHEDPGRVLAGVDGVEAANSSFNLEFTSEHINKSKGRMSNTEYVEKNADKLDEKVKEKMVEVDYNARKEYNQMLENAYYSSTNFWQDAVGAASKRGIELGAKHAIGLAFLDIWFSCKEQLLLIPNNSEIKDYYNAIITGIKNGGINIKNKYKDYLESFKIDFIIGSSTSLTTTLHSIYIDIDKNTIRKIRHFYTTIVQATNVLVFNAYDMCLGDRIKSCAITLSTGASILVGDYVGDAIEQICADWPYKDQIKTFLVILISGLMSCTMLLFLDKNKYFNDFVDKLNVYVSNEKYINKMMNDYFNNHARILELDINTLKQDTEKINDIVDEIYLANDDELENILTNIFNVYDVNLPWEDDFDKFMSNPNNKLRFG